MNVIELEQVLWNDRLEKLVQELKPVVGWEAIRDHVTSEAISAYEVYFDAVSIGYFLARESTLLNNEKQLVILHALAQVKGKTPLSSLLAVVIPGLAREKGYASVRIHSERRGMDALLEEAGYKFMENVFELRI